MGQRHGVFDVIREGLCMIIIIIIFIIKSGRQCKAERE